MPKIATVNTNNTSYTVTDGLFKKAYLLSNCSTNLVPNLDGSKNFYLVDGNQTLVVVSNTINTEFVGNSVFGTTDPDLAQTASQRLIGMASGSNTAVAAVAAVRVLANAGGTSYTQAYLQGLYDGQAGLAAPDTVPQAVSDYANTLNTTGYKVYLGANIWWYTNTATGISAANWATFGGSKSAFGAAIVLTGIITFK